MYYTYGQPMGYGADWSYLLLIAAFVISMIVQFRMQSTFSKFSSVAARNGMTGAQIAQMILQSEGLYNVRVNPVQGSLTDHYDPRTKTVNLSQTVYGKASLAAQSVAAHECGHAIQDARGYAPLRWRTSLVPVANFGSRFSWIMLMLGLFMANSFLIRIGVLLFALSLLFQLVTLPVEFNASSRALAKFQNSGWYQNDEMSACRKVLGAAAMTYVASACTSLMYLLRMLSLGRRR